MASERQEENWVVLLEEALAEQLNRGYAVAVSSGTAALYSATEALGIGPGDVVVSTPYTFVSTTASILARGAIPLFVDVDPASGAMSRTAAERVVDAVQSGDSWRLLLPEPLRAEARRVAAALPAHIYGIGAPVDVFDPLVADVGLAIIEDTAEALGAEAGGGMVGGTGDVATLAFSSGKQVFAWQGGAIVTDREDVAVACREIRNYGRDSAGVVVRVGNNYALNPMAAVLAIHRLRALPDALRHRERMSDCYREGLRDVEWLRPIETPPTTTRRAWFGYPVRVEEPASRSDLLDHLSGAGIRYKLYFSPVHLQPFLERAGYRPGSFPAAEALGRSVVTFTITGDTTEDEVASTCELVRAWGCRGGGRA
jgi:dTDP-4-amino-4,6-dideoxygalactose transaminase